ncbi:MAG: hypothetical protein AAFV53_26370 [Myxococcota bacterium]
MSESRLLSQIQTLMLEPDSASVAQGVELLSSLDDPELFDLLLANVYYTPEMIEHEEQSFGGLEPNLRFARASRAGHIEHVLLALLAAAPAGTTAARMRDKITSLTLGEMTAAPPHKPTSLTSLAYLDRFPSLRALCIRNWNRLESWQTLGALSNLEILHLEAPELPDDLSVLTRLPRLYQLVIDTGSLTGLSRLPALPDCRELRLRCTDWRPLSSLDLLSEWTHLERLYLRSPVASLGETFGTPNLRVLRLKMYQGYSLDGLERAPNLNELHLKQAIGLSDARALSSLKSLRRLRLGASRVLPTMPDLDAPLEELDIEGCRALQHLPAMPNAALKRLHLKGCASLEALPTVALDPALQRLDLSDLPSLVDVDALSTFTGLRALSLRGCAAIPSLPNLSSLDQLHSLDVRGCARLRQVGVLPRLRVLAIHGSGLRRTDLPHMVRWAVTASQNPRLQQLAQRDPPDALPPMTEDARQLIHAIQQRDIQAITAMLTAGLSQKTLHAMLHGVSYHSPRLQESFRLHCARGALPHLTAALLAALAGSNGHHSLRDAIDQLDVPGGGTLSIDLTPLGALPHLRRLALVRPRGLHGAPPPQVQELAIINAAKLDDLAALRGADGLRRLKITRSPLRSLDGIGDLPLTRLDIDHAPELSDGGALSGHPQMVRAHFASCPAEILSGVRQLPELRILSASRLRGPVDLRAFDRLPRLSTLTLRADAGFVGLDVLGKLPMLHELDLSESAIITGDALGEAVSLETIRLNRCDALVDVSALAKLPNLRLLEIGFCRNLTDISALAEAPALEEVWIRESGVRLRNLPEALRWRASQDARPM